MRRSKSRFVFFDRGAVQAAVDEGTRKALSKFGAYVRTRAKSSIRKRKSISKPGFPPSSHAGDLRRLILFQYDKPKNSVVIGPLPYHQSAADLLEYGGIRNGKFYRERPFMRPAFAAELKNAAGYFKDTIK